MVTIFELVALDLKLANWLLMLGGFIFGIAVIPIMPVLINFSSEITYP